MVLIDTIIWIIACLLGSFMSTMLFFSIGMGLSMPVGFLLGKLLNAPRLGLHCRVAGGICLCLFMLFCFIYEVIVNRNVLAEYSLFSTPQRILICIVYSIGWFISMGIWVTMIYENKNTNDKKSRISHPNSNDPPSPKSPKSPPPPVPLDPAQVDIDLIRGEKKTFWLLWLVFLVVVIIMLCFMRTIN